MNDRQIENLNVAIDQSADYWVLNVTTSDGSREEVKKWWAENSTGSPPDEEADGAPTISEIVSYCKLTPDAIKFTFACYAAKGSKRLKHVGFDPPPSSSSNGEGTDLKALTTALAMVVKAQGTETVNIIKATRLIMEESTRQMPNFGEFTRETVANLVEYERAKFEDRLEEEKERHEKDIEKELMLVQMTNELETAKTEGSFGHQMATALLEDPDKIRLLISHGVDSLEKLGRLRKAIVSGEASSE